ncbi:histidine kinase [Parapedobacter tibetensis]|uniref:histidine kinase n=1 Tax=Parapedobacter tibetensis TaxID=2972951 RepID=UPI00214D3CFA|nr:histidine kinase [Parapedobacter tibetensis]
MKQVCLLFGVLLIVGCVSQPDREHVEKQRQRGLALLKDAETEARLLSDVAKRTAYWQELLATQPFSSDSILLAKIHYQLAGVYYAKNDLDSIKWHMRRAWSLIERQDGVEDMMVLFNVGEGNIATHEQLIHQANYYYDLAVTMIQNADRQTLGLSNSQQAMIYLAAAQSDAGLHQYERAIARNNEAVRRLKADTAVSARLLLRAYDQLASDFLSVSEKQLDSAWVYIQRMETLAEEYPDAAIPRFLFDRKALYYGEVGESDSSIYYHRAILHIDEAKIASGGASPTDYANLFKDFVNLSDRFIQKRRLDSASFYLRRGERFIEEHGDYLSTKEHILYRENLVNFFFTSGQYGRAYQEHLNVLEATRELNENKYAQAIAEMSAIYELQAKEKSILELNRQVVIKEGQLAENRLLLVITTLSALLAIAVVVLLYTGRRQRRLRAEAERAHLQKNAIELEQRLLRTQMEPHFIFNTLGSLQSYIRLDEKQKALKYLKQFSRLLRNSLELSRESFVPLGDELETLRYYLGLQQMRYEEGFDFRIDHHTIDEEELQGWLIPPMLIQPFVENAIIHGVDSTEGKGLIDIVVLREPDEKRLRVTISDNGPGIDGTAALETKIASKKKSLSTAISRERLQILEMEKGMSFGVSVIDRNTLPGNQRGTLVELLIPLVYDF